MDGFRTPFFVFALLAFFLAVLTEGASYFGSPPKPSRSALVAAIAANEEIEEDDRADRLEELLTSSNENKPAPGLGIPAIALFDMLVLVTISLIGLSLLLAGRIHGRIQGVITLITAILVALGSIVVIFASLGLVLTMIGLLMAVPFGPLAYMAVWGFFDTGTAAALLSMSMFLKVACCVLLVLAQLRFITNKGLVLILLTSLVVNFLISFLHGFPPGLLVSITDAVGAIIVGIIALIWALVLGIGSILPIIKAFQVAPTQE
jgi:hypothetical protein